MNEEPELEAMATVLDALQRLTSDEQSRVLRWILDKLKLPDFVSAYPQVGFLSREQNTSKGESDLPQQSAIVATWVKQNGLTAADLESVFHLEGPEVAVIAANLPGSSTREKVLNCYVLTGIRELLRAGEPTFSDKSARDLCAEFGCLDTTNHAKYMNEKGNEFTGSKDKGWTLTAPGKKRGATLVKEIASGTK